MKNNILSKLSLFLTILFLCAGIFFLIKDIQQNNDLKISANQFYKVAGIAQKFVFHHPYSQGNRQTVEIYLKNKIGKWTYSSLEPHYQLLIDKLRKCKNAEFVFKTTDFIKNGSADIWNAKICGETVIQFSETLNDKYSQSFQNLFFIKIILIVLLIIFVLTSAYFLFRKY